MLPIQLPAKPCGASKDMGTCHPHGSPTWDTHMGHPHGTPPWTFWPLAPVYLLVLVSSSPSSCGHLGREWTDVIYVHVVMHMYTYTPLPPNTCLPISKSHTKEYWRPAVWQECFLNSYAIFIHWRSSYTYPQFNDGTTEVHRGWNAEEAFGWEQKLTH